MSDKSDLDGLARIIKKLQAENAGLLRAIEEIESLCLVCGNHPLCDINPGEPGWIDGECNKDGLGFWLATRFIAGDGE